MLASRISDFTRYLDAPEVTQEQLLRAHTAEYLDMIDAVMPREGYARLDPDTVISPETLQAAKRAAGSVILAVDQVMSGRSGMHSVVCVHPGIMPKATGHWGFASIAILPWVLSMPWKRMA